MGSFLQLCSTQLLVSFRLLPICSSDVATEQTKYILHELVLVNVEQQSVLKTSAQSIILSDLKMTKKK